MLLRAAYGSVLHVASPRPPEAEADALRARHTWRAWRAWWVWRAVPARGADVLRAGSAPARDHRLPRDEGSPSCARASVIMMRQVGNEQLYCLTR